MSKHPVEEIAEMTGGTIKSAGELPDGSGFATVSMPLPESHWLYAEGSNTAPPMLLRMGTADLRRQRFTEAVWAAAKYAIRATTDNGRQAGYDPDALCQNMVVGLLGYHTPDGLSHDPDVPEFDPDPVPDSVPPFGKC